MKKRIAAVFAALMLGLLVGAASAQQPTNPKPDLSTSDKVALNALERAKQDAEAAFKQALNSEGTIISEWNAAHPGFKVNPQTFAVEAIVPAVQPKPATKEPAK